MDVFSYARLTVMGYITVSLSVVFGQDIKLINYELLVMTGNDASTDPFFIRIGDGYSVTGWFKTNKTRNRVTRYLLENKPMLPEICSLTVRTQGSDSWQLVSIIIKNYQSRNYDFTFDVTFNSATGITNVTKHLQSVHGGWGSWLAWSECNSTCGPGVVTRTRKCNNPLPSCGGRHCNVRLYRENQKCAVICLSTIESGISNVTTARNTTNENFKSEISTKSIISKTSTSYVDALITDHAERVALAVSLSLGVFCLTALCSILAYAFRKKRQDDTEKLVSKKIEQVGIENSVHNAEEFVVNEEASEKATVEMIDNSAMPNLNDMAIHRSDDVIEEQLVPDAITYTNIQQSGTAPQEEISNEEIDTSESLTNDVTDLPPASEYHEYVDNSSTDDVFDKDSELTTEL